MLRREKDGMKRENGKERKNEMEKKFKKEKKTRVFETGQRATTEAPTFSSSVTRTIFFLEKS